MRGSREWTQMDIVVLGEGGWGNEHQSTEMEQNVRSQLQTTATGKPKVSETDKH